MDLSNIDILVKSSCNGGSYNNIELLLCLTCIQKINVFGQRLTFFNTGSYTVEMTIKRIKPLVYN